MKEGKNFSVTRASDVMSDTVRYEFAIKSEVFAEVEIIQNIPRLILYPIKEVVSVSAVEMTNAILDAIKDLSEPLS